MTKRTVHEEFGQVEFTPVSIPGYTGLLIADDGTLAVFVDGAGVRAALSPDQALAVATILGERALTNGAAPEIVASVGGGRRKSRGAPVVGHA